jgi:hypothetical protein
MSGSRTTRLSVLACVLLTGVNLLATRRLDLVFDVGFVLLCAGAALGVRPTDFFSVGVLPPLLLLGLCTSLSLVDRGAIAGRGDGFVQGLVTGLARHAASLAIGYALCLAVLAVRHRVIGRRPASRGQQPPGPRHSKREVSPAPYLTTSASPEERSTTVVGSDPHSPQSTTASSH